MNSYSCKLHVFAYQNMYTFLLFILIGVTLRLRGYSSIPTDGSGRIIITDINEDALICQSDEPTSTGGDWYLHPTHLTTDISDRIPSSDSRGWKRNSIFIDQSGLRRVVRLRRDESVASEGRALEGVFTCDIPESTPVSVGVYYPSESHVE